MLDAPAPNQPGPFMPLRTGLRRKAGQYIGWWATITYNGRFYEARGDTRDAAVARLEEKINRDSPCPVYLLNF
jgi:hypothetical protein